MLKAITNWNALRRALAAAGKEIYFCLDCEHVWIGDKVPPLRCANTECRAWANAPRYKTVGRPVKS